MKVTTVILKFILAKYQKDLENRRLIFVKGKVEITAFGKNVLSLVFAIKTSGKKRV